MLDAPHVLARPLPSCCPPPVPLLLSEAGHRAAWGARGGEAKQLPLPQHRPNATSRPEITSERDRGGCGRTHERIPLFLLGFVCTSPGDLTSAVPTRTSSEAICLRQLPELPLMSLSQRYDKRHLSVLKLYCEFPALSPPPSPPLPRAPSRVSPAKHPLRQINTQGGTEGILPGLSAQPWASRSDTQRYPPDIQSTMLRRGTHTPSPQLKLHFHPSQGTRRRNLSPPWQLPGVTALGRPRV